MPKKEKEFLNGDFNVIVEKKLSEDKESIITKLRVSDDLHKLLKEFSCTNCELVSSKIFEQEFGRYKIKKSLAGSVKMTPFVELLFSKELIDSKMVEFYFDEMNACDDISNKCQNEAVGIAENIIRLKNLEDGASVKFNLKLERMNST